MRGTKCIAAKAPTVKDIYFDLIDLTVIKKTATIQHTTSLSFWIGFQNVESKAVTCWPGF